MRIDNQKVCVIAEEDLKTIFDLAVNSLDFGSGFWDQPEVDVARRLAEALGLDPFETATPREMKANYPHAFVAYNHMEQCIHRHVLGHSDESCGYVLGFPILVCQACSKPQDWMNHVEVADA